MTVRDAPPGPSIPLPVIDLPQAVTRHEASVLYRRTHRRPAPGLDRSVRRHTHPGRSGRPKHRHRRDQALSQRKRWLGRAPAVAMAFHILAALALMPVSGHPYDLASLTSSSGAWLRWGVPLFYQWKFGFDLTILGIGSQSLSFVLQHLGMSGAAALATAWKLPLVLADLLVGVILVDLGRQLRSQRPTLLATLWLISPVPLWVSAGHGQLESLTVLAIVLSVDMLLRRRPMLAGVVVGLGIGIEYLPVLVALVVIFWLYVSVIKRREVYRFAAGCTAAVIFCFGPCFRPISVA